MSAYKPFTEISPIGAAIKLSNITPSDTEELPECVRSIYVGTGGNIQVVDTLGTTVIHKNVSSGSYLGPFYVVKVSATNTTASDLIGYV